MSNDERHEEPDRTRDNFETVYRVYHEVEYGFGGNTSIWIAVEEETEERIVGRKFGPMYDLPGNKIVVQKDKLAGWEEEQYRHSEIPEEMPTPSEDQLKRAYMNGHIDETELEEKLEEADL